jgi:hypothetical protein
MAGPCFEGCYLQFTYVVALSQIARKPLILPFFEKNFHQDLEPIA